MQFVAQGLSINGWPGLALLRKQRGDLGRSQSEAPGCSRSVENPAVWNEGSQKYHGNCFLQFVLTVVGEDGPFRAATTGYGFYPSPIHKVCWAEIPRSLQKLVFLAFIRFSVMSEHTDRRLCRARRATRWELCVLTGWREVSRVGFSAHLPFPIAAPCCSI